MADLTAARQLADAADKAAEGATEGPWTNVGGEDAIVGGPDVFGVAYYVAPRNRPLIAASRQLVPDMAATIRALCDEVERLRVRCDRYVTERNDALNINSARAQQLAKAWIAVDEARAELAAIKEQPHGI